jgi:hypothetical protein
VLNQLKQLASDPEAAAAAGAAAAAPGSKRRQPQPSTASGTVTLTSLLQHKHSRKHTPTTKTRAARAAAAAAAAAAAGSQTADLPPTAAAAEVCSRHDASRSFYELLVLQNRGYVGLVQQGAYRELVIRLTERMLDD